MRYAKSIVFLNVATPRLLKLYAQRSLNIHCEDISPRAHVEDRSGLRSLWAWGADAYQI